MSQPQSCLNCLNFKVNLRKKAGRCTAGKFACAMHISEKPLKEYEIHNQRLPEFMPACYFQADDGYLWIFDVNMEYWALWCAQYDHNPVRDKEEK